MSDSLESPTKRNKKTAEHEHAKHKQKESYTDDAFGNLI